jgi:hypothetical protein
MVLPMHPNPVKLTPVQLDSIVGEYHDSGGRIAATLFRQGEQLYEKDPHGEVTEVEAESPSEFFYPLGSIWTRLTVERDSQGHVTGLLYRDDRHEEKWERTRTMARTP